MSETDTRTNILETAAELIQHRGYNGFSFHDLAARVGIKTASVHYHFPTKGDLGVALVRRHRATLVEALARLEAEEPDPWGRLRRYAGLFRATLEQGHKMCLGGMLAAEHRTLPPELVAEVRGFIEDHERWLSQTIQAGRKAGVVTPNRPADEVARAFFAALEGAILAACAFGEFGRFDTAAAWHLGQLRA